MLRPPHTRYTHLYVYYLDQLQIPPIDHPDLIGVWIEDQHAILFFHTPQAQLVSNICRRAGAQIIYQADLDYRDWEAGVTIGKFMTKSLAVRPVWEQFQNNESEYRQEIVLDTSVIFGSGFHPTTRLCLEALEMVMLESGVNIRRVADLGTGTGLLAVAAAKLGAEHVLAVDNNPLACAVVRKNVALNNCDTQVEVQNLNLLSSMPDLGSYDLVIANLYKALLVQLFSDPQFWKAKLYLISGIIPGMEGELLCALPQKSIRFLHRANNDIWRLWVLSTDMMSKISS